MKDTSQLKISININCDEPSEIYPLLTEIRKKIKRIDKEHEEVYGIKTQDNNCAGSFEIYFHNLNEKRFEEKVLSLVERHEKLQDSHTWEKDTLVRLEYVMRYFKQLAARSTANGKELIEKMLSHYLAISLMAEGVGMAQTHGDKNARLRGLIDVLNNTIRNLREHQNNALRNSFGEGSWHWNSDFPYRKMLDERKQLEIQNKHLKTQLEAYRQGKNPDDEMVKEAIEADSPMPW